MFILAGNEAELERLYGLLDHHKAEIAKGNMPVYVDGYCASLSTTKENLNMAFARANRVKSELIIRKGLKEADFITANYARVYEDNKDMMKEGDLDWSGVKALVPDTTSYVRTDYADIAPRIGDAELVLINKCRIDEAVLAQCPNLKWVGIIATGTDNIDLDACRRHGVAVANVPGYSTYSVAQMTFSLLLAICQCAQRYDRAVKAGYWQLGIPAEYGLLPQVELLGKTFGIYGYGSIGRQTARIAKAFGMEVLVCTRTVRPEYDADGVEFVDFDTLLARSDVLSLHCPATPATRGLMSREALAKMKPGAILLNTARGALVDEEAVADALESGKLAFYGADAFATEPLPPQSRLRSLPGAVLTPHIAWTTKEALQRLMDITTGNLRSFLAGKGENIVNP